MRNLLRMLNAGAALALVAVQASAGAQGSAGADSARQVIMARRAALAHPERTAQIAPALAVTTRPAASVRPAAPRVDTTHARVPKKERSVAPTTPPNDSGARVAPRASPAIAPVAATTASAVDASASHAADSTLREMQRALTQLRGEVADLRAARDKADSAARASASKTRAPDVAKAPATTTPAPPPAVVPKSIESGFGSIKLSGLIQTWYTNGSLQRDNTIRIRRAELKFTGKVAPTVSWSLMVDPAKSLALKQTTTTVNGQKVVTDESVTQSSRMLQDAFVSIGLARGLSLDVGQYKLPFAHEGPNSTAKVLTVERPMFASDRARGGSLGDVRDIGATLRGKPFQRVDLAVGVFDGTGEAMNTTDTNDQKVLVGTLLVPITGVRGLALGVSGVYGAEPNTEHPRRDRLAGQVEFIRSNVTARAEYVRGTDGDLHRMGYYGLIAYRFTEKLELVQRFDFFDPDVRRATNATDEGASDVLAGINYYIAGHNAKVQLNAVNRSWQHHRVPSSRQLLLNVQTSW